MPWEFKSLTARMALPVAGLVLAAAGVYSAHNQAPVWIVTRAIPAGADLSLNDVSEVSAVPSEPPPAHTVARVALEPGQTLVAADVGHPTRARQREASLTVAESAATMNELAVGDQVEFAATSGAVTWVSPTVVVMAIQSGTYGGGGSVTIGASLSTLREMVTHDLGQATVINLGDAP